MTWIESAILGAVALAILSCWWYVRPAARARRRARAALRTIERTLAAIARPAKRAHETLVEHGARYADAAAEERLASIPVEDLKPFGAEKVRWSALHDAGYVTLGDLAALGRTRLVQVKGVGAVSAQRIAAARKRLRAANQKEPVPPPPAGDTTRNARPLVRAARDALVVRGVLGTLPDELRGLADDTRLRYRTVRRRTSAFFGILAPFGRQRREARAAAIEEADELRREVATHSRAAGLLTRARHAADAARTTLAEKLTDTELRDDHVQRFAEYCATIEHALPERFAGRAGGRGGLPDEIVDRVDAFPLRIAGLRVTLRPYQEFGVKYLLTQERALLGDEMGLGKTIEALAVLVHVRESGEGERFLVVCPASVLHSWAREVERLTELDAHVVHGTDKAQALARWREGAGVAVTSFGTLRGLVASHDDLPPVDVLVVDEAHYVKNPEAERTRATAEMTKRAKRVLFLTGTPLENRLDEFRRLIGLLQPKVVQRIAKAVVAGGIGHTAFQNVVAPVYLRRNQEDVLFELPERIDKEEWIELDESGAAEYARAVAAKDMMAMRRSVTIGGLHGVDAAQEGSAKLLRLSEILAEHEEGGRKVLVFSFFLDVIAAIEARFETHGRITGATPPLERTERVDAFSALPGHAILVAQIQAAGVGLNLQAASVVVLMEPQWKPSTEAQAIARAHRMGQTNTVLVHRLLAKDTVDERVRDLVSGKEELFETYARGSSIKEASEASLSRIVLEAESARLASPR